MAVKKIISQKYLAENEICKFREDNIELENGIKQKRLVVETTPGAMIFALTKDNKILLVNNFIYGYNKYFYGLPAGYMDKDETPEQTAKRELKEETGYESDEWEYLGEIYVKPERTNKITHAFLAKNCRKTSEQNLDESEYLTFKKVKIDKFFKMIENKEIKVADTLSTTLLALIKLNKIK